MKNLHGIIVISSPGCAPCEHAKQSLRKASISINVVERNSDQGMTIASRLGLNHDIPVIIRFVDGKPIEMIHGWMEKRHLPIVKRWAGVQ